MIIYLLVTLIMAWLLCDIDPSEHYSWYSGIWHGMFFIPNLIRSIFTDAVFKAHHYTAAYNVFWWIFTVQTSVATLLGGLFGRKR